MVIQADLGALIHVKAGRTRNWCADGMTPVPVSQPEKVLHEGFTRRIRPFSHSDHAVGQAAHLTARMDAGLSY
jgi:hypothetical protein